MNHSQPTIETSNSTTEDIDLFALLEALWEGRMVWLSTLVAGVVMGALALLVLPEKYEAVSLLKIGQVLVNNNNNIYQIETPAEMVERVSSPEFFEKIAVAARAKGITIALEDKAFVAKIVKNASFVLLTTHGANRKEAEALMQVTITRIRESQKKRFDELYTALINEKQLLEKRLSMLEGDVELIRKRDSKVSGKGAVEYSILTSLYLGKDAELNFVRSRLQVVNNALSPANSFETDTVEGVFVKDKPVSPRRLITMAIATILGLMLGFALLLLKNSYRQYREKRAGV